MKKLMAHLVAGNPNIATTKNLINAMVEREVVAIELQIPFSDPIADGPVLMTANDAAVRQGVSVDETIKIIESVDFKETKALIMSYIQPIIAYGPEEFFERAVAAGCSGFIIPDLPFDAPETRAFIAGYPKLHHKLVPVLSPGMPVSRLRLLFEELDPDIIYMTARHGITGERTKFGDDIGKTIAQIRHLSSAKLAVGFGIQTPYDVRYVLKHADLAIVGSALTQALKRNEKQALELLDLLCKAA